MDFHVKMTEKTMSKSLQLPGSAYIFENDYGISYVHIKYYK